MIQWAQHQIWVGYLLIFIGTVGLALSAFLKSAGDKAGAQQEGGKVRRYTFYCLFTLVVAVCCGSNLCGTYITKKVADEKLNAANKASATAQAEQSKTIAELKERVGLLIEQLKAVTKDDLNKMTEEKLRVIRADIAQWAKDLNKDSQLTKSNFSKLKLQAESVQAARDNEILEAQKQRSAKCYPAFSFAIRLMQESVRAYATNSANTNITVEPFELPDNFYAGVSDYNKQLGTIHIRTNSIWKFRFNKGPVQPYLGNYDFNTPYLLIIFNRTDRLAILIDNSFNNIRFVYTAHLPIPDPLTINGEYPLANYEDKVREILPQIIKSQLLQTEQ